MTRRLNDLYINAVIDAINSDTIEKVCISQAKKPRGAYNITYKVIEPGVMSTNKTSSKGTLKIQLINALKEVKLALADNKIQFVNLQYDRADDKFVYQLIQN